MPISFDHTNTEEQVEKKDKRSNWEKALSRVQAKAAQVAQRPDPNSFQSLSHALMSAQPGSPEEQVVRKRMGMEQGVTCPTCGGTGVVDVGTYKANVTPGS